MNFIDMPATGRNIQDIFARHGITKKQAADKIGVTPAAVGKWCKGACMPTIDNFVVMAGMFDVRIDDIVCTRQA